MADSQKQHSNKKNKHQSKDESKTATLTPAETQMETDQTNTTKATTQPHKHKHKHKHDQQQQQQSSQAEQHETDPQQTQNSTKSTPRRTVPQVTFELFHELAHVDSAIRVHAVKKLLSALHYEQMQAQPDNSNSQSKSTSPSALLQADAEVEARVQRKLGRRTGKTANSEEKNQEEKVDGNEDQEEKADALQPDSTNKTRSHAAAIKIPNLKAKYTKDGKLVDEEHDVGATTSALYLGSSSNANQCFQDVKYQNLPTLAYSLKRLIKGLASPNDAARQGFAFALTQVLKMFSVVDTQDIIHGFEALLMLSKRSNRQV